MLFEDKHVNFLTYGINRVYYIVNKVDFRTINEQSINKHTIKKIYLICGIRWKDDIPHLD